MSLVRYNNRREFLPSNFSNLFDQFFNDSFDRTRHIDRFVPRVDIAENDKSFEVQLAAPGMKKEDFKIELNENNLVITGERKFENEKNEKNFRRVETQYGAFSRSFRLPENVNVDKIKAAYKNGILNLEIPKVEKPETKTLIEVK